MPATEYDDWKRFHRAVEPVGDARGDWQAALIASTVANANRKANSPPFKVSDWLLRWGESKRQDMRKMYQVMSQWARRWNKQVAARQAKAEHGDNRKTGDHPLG